MKYYKKSVKILLSSSTPQKMTARLSCKYNGKIS